MAERMVPHWADCLVLTKACLLAVTMAMQTVEKRASMKDKSLVGGWVAQWACWKEPP